MLKYKKLFTEEKYTLMQEIPLHNNLNTSYVTKMVLHGEGYDAHIYIGTYDGIYCIPVQSCSEHTTCISCTQAQDPYCSCIIPCSKEPEPEEKLPEPEEKTPDIDITIETVPNIVVARTG